jgi:hypothetical protein
MNWTNILERAAWTLVEGFIIGIPATLTLSDLPDLQAIMVGSLLAGALAVVSFIKTVAQERLEQLKNA